MTSSTGKQNKKEIIFIYVNLLLNNFVVRLGSYFSKWYVRQTNAARCVQKQVLLSDFVPSFSWCSTVRRVSFSLHMMEDNLSQPYRTLLEHSSAFLSSWLRAGLDEWLTAPIYVAWLDVHPSTMTWHFYSKH